MDPHVAKLLGHCCHQCFGPGSMAAQNCAPDQQRTLTAQSSPHGTTSVTSVVQWSTVSDRLFMKFRATLQMGRMRPWNLSVKLWARTGTPWWCIQSWWDSWPAVITGTLMRSVRKNVKCGFEPCHAGLCGPLWVCQNVDVGGTGTRRWIIRADDGLCASVAVSSGCFLCSCLLRRFMVLLTCGVFMRDAIYVKVATFPTRIGFRGWPSECL